MQTRAMPHFRPPVIRVAILAALVAHLLPLQSAHACEPVKLCMEWEVQLEDGEFGDYLTDAYAPARGNRITIIRPHPEPPLGVFLDGDGCIEFETQYAAGHKLVAYAEAVVGLGTSAKVHIKSFASIPDSDDDVDYTWSVDVPTILDDHDVVVSVPTDEYDLVTRMVTAAHVIHRLHDLVGSLLSGTYTLRLYHPRNDYAMGNPATAPSFFDAPISVALHRAHAKNKFIIAHEIGHWLQFQLAGGWQFSYSYPPEPNMAEPPCLFSVKAEFEDPDLGPLLLSAHGMRSAEYSSGAMSEGFAHFIAAVAYNDISEEDGVFKYYKETDHLAGWEDFSALDGQISLLGGSGSGVVGGPSAHVANMCTTDWNWPLQTGSLAEEVTSEIDWLRFFWRFLTAQDVGLEPQPTFWEVAHLVRFTQAEYMWSTTNHVLWPLMLSAISDVASGLDDFETRFVLLSEENGIYNDD